MTDSTSLSNGPRVVWIACFCAVAGLLAYAYYAQYALYLDPCPLCITQRAFYVGIGIAALVGLFTIRRALWQRIATGVLALSAIGGVITAGRQVWLQHLPPELVPECGPGLQYWLENMPMLQTLTLLFKGDGNCAEVHWTFLGFSMGEWSLAWFVLFLVTAAAMAIRGRTRRRHASVVSVSDA